MDRIHWQDAVTFLAGLVLVAAPFVLNITPPEGMGLGGVTWNFVLVGAAAVVSAGAALYAYSAWEEWFTLLLGLWMVVSPWAVGFSAITVLTWIAVICGALIAIMAVAALIESRPQDLA